MIFIPISDDNPLRFIPYQWVTIGLIAINIIVFIWQITGIGPTPGASFALVPSELFQVGIFGGPANGRYDTISFPEGCTLLTYMYFHADFLHLSSNMLFLWVFGDNVEDAMGHLKYLIFYTACGVAGGVAHAWMSTAPWLPLVGASGAVAGVITAYLMLHPHVRVWVLAFRVIPMRITAVWILGVWVATQVFMLAFSRGEQVAWSAHIGGMIAGAALVLVLRRPGVPLFDHDLASSEGNCSIIGHAVPSAPSEVP